MPNELTAWIDRHADVLSAEIRTALDRYPRAATELRDALAEGRIDGSAFLGPCRCLYGTIGRVKHTSGERLAEKAIPMFRASDYILNDPPPGYCLILQCHTTAEVLFEKISDGDTPADNAASAFAYRVVCEWIAERQAAADGAREASEVLTDAR